MSLMAHLQGCTEEISNVDNGNRVGPVETADTGVQGMGWMAPTANLFALDASPVARRSHKPDGSLPAVRCMPRYSRKEKIGNGGHGTVWMCIDNKTGRHVAIKVENALPPHRKQQAVVQPTSPTSDGVAVPRVVGSEPVPDITEAIALALLRPHPLIIRLIDVCDLPRAPSGTLQVLVLEYVDGGDLFTALEEGEFPLERTPDIAFQLVDALEYIHSRGIVHGDIKLENVLIDSSMMHIKLCDFGVAGRIGQRRIGRPVATVMYMAPELLALGTDDMYELDLAIDIWSLAIIIFAMLFGQLPWDAATHDDPLYSDFKDMLAANEELDAPWCLMEPNFRHSILAALDENPRHRPLAADMRRAMTGPWLNPEPSGRDSGTCSPSGSPPRNIVSLSWHDDREGDT